MTLTRALITAGWVAMATSSLAAGEQQLRNTERTEEHHLIIILIMITNMSGAELKDTRLQLHTTAIIIVVVV